MRLGSLSDWITVEGSRTLPLGGAAGLTLEVVSTGCSLVVEDCEGNSALIFAGDGYSAISFATSAESVLKVVGSHDGAMTSLRWPRDRKLAAEWRDGDSFVQLDPPPAAVAPEIRALMEQMQRNAQRREAALRSDFEAQLARLREKVPAAGQKAG